MPPHVTTDQVIAFRLRNHGLLDRAPLADLERVVGACGACRTARRDLRHSR